VGLPDRAAVGQPFSFQIVGDLTIRGVARPATFEATVTPESAERLRGSAVTTIRYADWGISIPQVPAVTGVSEQVQLQLDFVAEPA
jgi:polyisoprenoid-binding protein YceI